MSKVTLLPCPNPYCFADKPPRIVSTGVDCMTQCNHTVQCSCGITVAGMSIKEAVNAWNFLPRALTWTEEPPRTVGMYWWRQDPCSKYWAYKVRLIPKIHGLITYDHRDAIAVHVEDIGGQWAGPIPEPREPKE